MTTDPLPAGKRYRTCRVTRRRWLSDDTFILGLARPAGFSFQAGQRIRIVHDGHQRDYSLIAGETSREMDLLVRRIAGGVVSVHLSECATGSDLCYAGPAGHFLYRPSPRPAVFIATGTGIAPFAAMCREGASGFVMLQGGRSLSNLYCRDLVERAARRYIPCISRQELPLPSVAFPGRVTDCLQRKIPSGDYDFYLAGRRTMIAEAINIIDDKFPSSRIYSEIFY
jgi:ferredoxin-NADP reductase